MHFKLETKSWVLNQNTMTIIKIQNKKYKIQITIELRPHIFKMLRYLKRIDQQIGVSWKERRPNVDSEYSDANIDLNSEHTKKIKFCY